MSGDLHGHERARVGSFSSTGARPRVRLGSTGSTGNGGSGVGGTGIMRATSTGAVNHATGGLHQQHQQQGQRRHASGTPGMY